MVIGLPTIVTVSVFNFAAIFTAALIWQTAKRPLVKSKLEVVS